MKSINLLAIIAIVLVVVIIAVTLCFIIGKNGEKNDEIDVLNCSDLKEVKEFIEENEIEAYSFDTDYCHMSNVSVLNSEATVEIFFKNEATSQFKVYYTLFQCVDENASQEELENFDIMSYSFSQEDKDEINIAFDRVKKSFENKLGCILEQYDLIPTQEGVEVEDNDEKFYQGLLIKEYSVRDSWGTIWLLRLEASYGMARATLIKVVDDSGYEGFIPSVDMTKEQN